jgi:hypothetical protein
MPTPMPSLFGSMRNWFMAERTWSMRGLGPPVQQSPAPVCSDGQDMEHDWSNMT